MVIFPIFFCSVFNIFMATEGKAIIFYRSNFFFVSIDERSAMGSQPNLASRSKVMSIYKCSPPPKKNRGLPPIWGAKLHQFLDHFFRDFRSTPRISGMKLQNDKQKCYCQSTLCSLKVYLLSVTFDPETAKIHLLILTNPSAAITLQSSKLFIFPYSYHKIYCQPIYHYFL